MRPKNNASKSLLIKEGRHLVQRVPNRRRHAKRTKGKDQEKKNKGEDAHLALKILHYIQKVVVHVWFVMELHLDRVQVAQRVRHIQRPIVGVGVALSRVGSRDGGSSIAVAVLHRSGLGLGGRRARAGTRGRASEGVVRTQPQRGWRGLRLYWIPTAASSIVDRPLSIDRALDFVRGCRRLGRAREGSRLVGA